MSVQFRSRIKSTIDYSNILNGLGTCCDGQGNKTQKSFIDCFNDGGNFYPERPEDVVCPVSDNEIGCCCACSFVDDLTQLPYPWNFDTENPNNNVPYLESGVECNISRCECERIGGKFTPSTDSSVSLTSVNWKNYCVKSAPEFGSNYKIDARYPRACCHLDINELTGWPTDIVCENTCTAGDCANLGSLSYPAIYDNIKICNRFLYIDNSTPGGFGTCNTSLKLTKITQKNNNYKNSTFGSCYTLELNDNNEYQYTCDVTPKFLCKNGYWVNSSSTTGVYCNDTYTPNDPVKSTSVLYEPQKLTQTEFDDLKLIIGQKYQGGVYIGVYEPGSPINPKGSQLYGNLKFGTPEEHYPTNIGNNGSSYKKWAIIVDEKIFKTSFLDTSEEDSYVHTSLWDGYYNIYGNGTSFSGINNRLTNTFKYKPKNGFIDYYIPSLYELYFYSQYLRNKLTANKLYGNFMSSTLFNSSYIQPYTNKTVINNKGFVYGQTLSRKTKESHKTFISEKTDNLNVLFFRKIVIT